jgi:hypothetical protein
LVEQPWQLRRVEFPPWAEHELQTDLNSLARHFLSVTEITMDSEMQQPQVVPLQTQLLFSVLSPETL